MKIINPIRILALTAMVTAPMLFAEPANLKPAEPDRFERTIPATGSSKFKALVGAPSPKVNIAGKEHNAKFVIVLDKNILYKYDKNGAPQTAYLIASGKKSTPTHKGVRVVSHVETYPYTSAPATTKRRKTPKAFGPKIIVVNVIDTTTGEQSYIGEYIHGNNDINSLGKYASGGCIRMDNEVIKQLASEVKRGDVVIIQ